MKLSLDHCKHYISGYHISHFLLSISFVFLKTVRPFCTYVFEEEENCSLDWNETNILFFLICTLLVKNRRGLTFDELTKKIFMFSKVANFLLYFYCDLRLAVIYLALLVVIVVTCPEPIYNGPQDITYFSPETLQDELQNNPRNTWLIEFYTTWSAKCKELATPFAQLSVQYSHNHLKFGKVDVGRHVDVATKHMIDTSATSAQLPTLILFQGGKESTRKPGKTRKGIAKYAFSVESIIRDFDLPSLFESTKSKTQKKAEKMEENKTKEAEEMKEEDKKTK